VTNTANQGAWLDSCVILRRDGLLPSSPLSCSRPPLGRPGTNLLWAKSLRTHLLVQSIVHLPLFADMDGDPTDCVLLAMPRRFQLWGLEIRASRFVPDRAALIGIGPNRYFPFFPRRGESFLLDAGVLSSDDRMGRRYQAVGVGKTVGLPSMASLGGRRDFSAQHCLMVGRRSEGGCESGDGCCLAGLAWCKPANTSRLTACGCPHRRIA